MLPLPNYRPALTLAITSLLLLGCAAAPPVSCPQKDEPPQVLMQPPLALSKDCLREILAGKDPTKSEMCQWVSTGTPPPAGRP